MAGQQNPSSTSTPMTPVTDNPKGGIELQQYTQEKSSHWQLVIDQTHVTPAVINWPYNGSGTEETPMWWSISRMIEEILFFVPGGQNG
jgi:hypothetical protein